MNGRWKMGAVTGSVKASVDKESQEKKEKLKLKYLTINNKLIKKI